ncbi:MAG: hypothetical protein JXB05_11470 [Myxococcaceae bacterium]|nr:hypothetical protein [Myxococcaceae bacterium]
MWIQRVELPGELTGLAPLGFGVPLSERHACVIDARTTWRHRLHPDHP